MTAACLPGQLRCGEQLAFLRRDKQITQEQLAQAMGVTNQAVSKWESGVSHSLRYGIRYDNTTLI